MNKIIEKEHFSEKVVKLVVEAPMIARSRRPGHFVIVRAGEHGERIPLTIADADIERGTITLVIQAIGNSTQKICALNPGDYLTDVVGPLGKATHIENVGTVVCCGGGVGVEKQFFNGHGIRLCRLQQTAHIPIYGFQTGSKLPARGGGDGTVIQGAEGVAPVFYYPPAHNGVAGVNS